jgi:hypothetical protein
MGFSRKQMLIVAAIVVVVLYVENHDKQLSALVRKIPVVGPKLVG